MKPVIADFKYRITCIRIVPVAGDPILITDHIRNVRFPSGNVYLSDAGYEFTGNSSESNMAPGTFDLEGVIDLAGIDRDSVASGFFDNAKMFLFNTTWSNPIEDEEQRVKAILGKATITDNRYSIEAMGLIDALNQSVGQSYTATCQKTFGNSTGPLITRCNKALGPLTVTGTLTSVTNRLICRDSTRAEAADYFAYGLLSFTSGANAGLKAIQVKRHESDGTLELFEAMPYPMVIGDAYSLIPGCRKRLEDCRDKFNNVINFGGFTRIPTNNQANQWG